MNRTVFAKSFENNQLIEIDQFSPICYSKLN